ncbi:hypothetical protein BaRGS_00008138 [Batillaria attramentaria]|uniref:Uncharacterized protein n=1 Tax=Batillaria attramentaria TaxID=370345 RepID=A0ABD0LMY3_9CAEN
MKTKLLVHVARAASNTTDSTEHNEFIQPVYRKRVGLQKIEDVQRSRTSLPRSSGVHERCGDQGETRYNVSGDSRLQGHDSPS